ncbi:hypothetical protein HMPREF0381_1114 [Lachnoanaerobaculum saburreum DSM 3986]|uniref:Uncharacterized protein n=1 Tax=Lachnoanaerobaculum saburreum DSM 3986 TaxID=887325 RepID=E6LMC9_9FIRM|nr:hypothetical protein HMPREF0381_1114 [Lachnoanaerobaculum saburreum DSM 3986]
MKLTRIKYNLQKGIKNYVVVSNFRNLSLNKNGYYEKAHNFKIINLSAMCFFCAYLYRKKLLL